MALSQAVVELPGDLSITAVDVSAHETIARLAEGHGELTGLALWLMAERQKVTLQLVLLIVCCPDQVDVQACIHENMLLKEDKSHL